MRTIAYVTAACLLLAAGTSACTDISEYNPGGLTSQTVFTTPAGFESLVNAAYAYQRWWYGKEEAINMTETGTDLFTSGAGDTHPSLTTYQSLEGSETAVTQLWGNLYSGINLVNAGINSIDKAGFSPTQHDTRLAELRFLRAFYYWHVVETWGGVHFSLEETTSAVSTANKTPVDTFYAQIFSDLDYAVNHLPKTTTDYGRVTKGAARAFQARMYLTRGQNQQAYDAATDVINNYGYKLLTKYSDLWRMDNLVNSEIVYAVNYSVNTALDDAVNTILFPGGHPRGGNNAHLMFLMIYDKQPGMLRDITYGRPFNRYMPTKFLLNLFDPSKDARYEGSFETMWLANGSPLPAGIKLGDTAVVALKYAVTPEFRASKKYRIYDINDEFNATGVPAQRLYYPPISKFMDPTRPSAQEQVSGRDCFVIRLAEMYLDAAEAKLNLGDQATAAQLINVVRSRAAVTGKTADMQITPADVTIDFILDERAREFAGEQIRWFDLKRTGKLVERVTKYNPDAAPWIKAFHTVRPIPQTQIDAVTNKDEFKQNAGYK